MPFVSYKPQRMKELRDGVKERNGRAEDLLVKHIKAHTPIETLLLRKNIFGHTTEEEVVVGFNAPQYGIYVHQGTMDFAHGHDGWTEQESYELEAWKSAQDRRGGSTEIIPPKGLMPRPFLVYGAVQAKKYLPGVYTPIN
jgi:hypothetical protein